MTAEEIVSWLALKALSYNLAAPDGFTIHNPIQTTNCDMHKLEKPNHEDSMISEVIFVFKKWKPLQSWWLFSFLLPFIDHLNSIYSALYARTESSEFCS